MNQLTEERVREIVREEMEKKAAEATTTFECGTAFRINGTLNVEDVGKKLSQVLDRHVEKRNEELSKLYRPEHPWGVNLRE